MSVSRHWYYEVYKDRRGNWRWRLVAANGRIIAVASECYKQRTTVLKILERIRAQAPTAPVVMEDPSRPRSRRPQIDLDNITDETPLEVVEEVFATSSSGQLDFGAYLNDADFAPIVKVALPESEPETVATASKPVQPDL